MYSSLPDILYQYDGMAHPLASHAAWRCADYANNAVSCCTDSNPGGTTFCSDDDSLVLEDEGARMTLRSECNELQPDKVVTGMLALLCGCSALLGSAHRHV